MVGCPQYERRARFYRNSNVQFTCSEAVDHIWQLGVDPGQSPALFSRGAEGGSKAGVDPLITNGGTLPFLVAVNPGRVVYVTPR